jgi:YD repeat-containing protein
MRHHALTLIKVLLLTCLLSFAIAAQSTSATDGSTPLGLQPGTPAGSYALSGFDNVNLYNGNLSFQLSLLGVAGRGGAQAPVMLPIEGKWRVTDLAIPQFGGGVIHRFLPIQSWWEINERKYSAGSVAGRQMGFDTMTCPDNTNIFVLTLTRLTFTAPDGTEYELRDQLRAGQPADNQLCNYLNPPSRGTTFVSSDGSAATFISDAPIYDQVIAPAPSEIYPSGYLWLRDGTRFRVENGLVTSIRDRNGNKLSFTYDGNNRVQSITDSLNRQITISRNTGPGTFDQITYKGFAGMHRSIKINYLSLANALRSDYATTRTYKSLFPELDGSSVSQHNPSVVSSITLPNNKEYQVKYNQYGEVARVVLPTGGAIEYDYAAGVSDGYTSGALGLGFEGSWVVYRRVIERRLYPDGGTGATYSSRTTYSRPETYATNLGYVIVDQLNNSGTLLTRSKHYFNGSPKLSFGISPIEYAGWKEGREYQTEHFASNGTTILSRSTNTWQQRAAVSWWSGNSDLAPPNDPRVE